MSEKMGIPVPQEGGCPFPTTPSPGSKSFTVRFSPLLSLRVTATVVSTLVGANITRAMDTDPIEPHTESVPKKNNDIISNK